MPVPSQQTFTAGNTLTAAQLNDDLRNAVNQLINPPMVKVFNSADWMNWAATGVVYLTTWNSEAYDTDTMHSNVVNTGRIVFTTAGVYRVAHKLHVVAPGVAWAGASRINFEYRLNGTATVVDDGRGNPVDSNIGTVHPHSFDRKFAAADYIELWAGWAIAGPAGALSPALTSGEAFTNLSAQWIGTGA